MDDLVTAILVLGASALAIGLLVVLNLLLGGWTPAQLRGEEDVMRALDDGVFGFRAAPGVGLAADGRGALALEQDGDRLGLVTGVGDRLTVRALRPGEISAVERDGSRLTLVLNDYTLSRVDLRFADMSEAQRWESTAAALQAPRVAPDQRDMRHA
jgi:hypothetical protein